MLDCSTIMNFVNYQAKAVKTSKHYFIWTSEYIPPHNCNIPAAQILEQVIPLILAAHECWRTVI